MRTHVTALLVMPRERRLPILEQLEACGVLVLPACNCAEARRILASGAAVQVVLTDTVLPDGDWSIILEDVGHSRANAEVVVCSPAATQSLCSEIFRRGAYDLLIEPYAKDEVRRVLDSAAARTYMRSLRLGANGRPAAAAG